MIRYLIIGAIIGIANIIPAVSGGTMAVAFNVYDSLIFAISNFTKDIKKHLKLLIPLGIGAGAGILLFAKILEYCMSTQYMLTNFFFIGVVVGSIPLIYGKATNKGEQTVTKKTTPVKIYVGNTIAFLIALLIMVFMILNSNASEPATVITSLSVSNFFYLLVSGIIAAACMVIPGISGSFVLILMGSYTTIITAVSDLNIMILLPVGIGVLIGIFATVKLIEKVLQKYSSQTYFAILGFVVGSVPVIINNVYLANAFKGGIYILWSILIIIFGTLLSYFSTRSKSN